MDMQTVRHKSSMNFWPASSFISASHAIDNTQSISHLDNASSSFDHLKAIENRDVNASHSKETGKKHPGTDNTIKKALKSTWSQSSLVKSLKLTTSKDSHGKRIKLLSDSKQGGTEKQISSTSQSVEAASCYSNEQKNGFSPIKESQKQSIYDSGKPLKGIHGLHNAKQHWKEALNGDSHIDGSHNESIKGESNIVDKHCVDWIQSCDKQAHADDTSHCDTLSTQESLFRPTSGHKTNASQVLKPWPDVYECRALDCCGSDCDLESQGESCHSPSTLGHAEHARLNRSEDNILSVQPRQPSVWTESLVGGCIQSGVGIDNLKNLDFAVRPRNNVLNKSVDFDEKYNRLSCKVFSWGVRGDTTRQTNVETVASRAGAADSELHTSLHLASPEELHVRTLSSAFNTKTSKVINEHKTGNTGLGITGANQVKTHSGSYPSSVWSASFNVKSSVPLEANIANQHGTGDTLELRRELENRTPLKQGDAHSSGVTVFVNTEPLQTQTPFLRTPAKSCTQNSAITDEWAGNLNTSAGVADSFKTPSSSHFLPINSFSRSCDLEGSRNHEQQQDSLTLKGKGIDNKTLAESNIYSQNSDSQEQRKIVILNAATPTCVVRGVQRSGTEISSKDNGSIYIRDVKQTPCIDSGNAENCDISEQIEEEWGSTTVLDSNQTPHKPPVSLQRGTTKQLAEKYKKQIALFRGKYRVDFEHHSTASSNISLGSSRSSGRRLKLSVDDLPNMMPVDKSGTRLGRGRYVNSAMKSDLGVVRRGAPCTSSSLDRSDAVHLQGARKLPIGDMSKPSKLELSYTSQDSGFVPSTNRIGSGRSQREISPTSHYYTSERSSIYSDPSQPHVSASRHAGAYVTDRPASSAGYSDTSHSVDMSQHQVHSADAYNSDSHHRTQKGRSRSVSDLHHKRKLKVIREHQLSVDRSYSQNDFLQHSVDSFSNVGSDGSDVNSVNSSLKLMATVPAAACAGYQHVWAHHVDPRDAQRAHFSRDMLDMTGIESQVLGQAPPSQAPKRTRKRDRDWGTVGNIPNSVGYVMPHAEHEERRERYKERPKSCSFDNVRVSMANESAYAPGVSLEDKLRLAASKGQVERIPELLAKGATYEPDREGRTAIHYAALSGYAEAVRMLIANGCDVNTRDNLGYTALHRAAAQGHIEVIRVLCEEACDLDVQDEVHGNTALHEASWNGYSKTVEILTKYKANVTLLNKAGFSALHLAAQNGHNQSARALLYAGCSPDCKNNYGDTSLHTAARYGHAGVTRILLSARCRANEQNKNGDTALHIASALKRKKIAKLLVESNISIGIKNKQNETATDVSRRKDHPEIMMIITSQPKLQKKKKKEEKERKKLAERAAKTAAMEEGEEQLAKKDKKGGFFFKKRSKSKDKENKENRDASRDRSRDRAAPSASLDVHTGAANTGSQSDLLNSETYADQLYSKQKADKARQSQGTSTGGRQQIHGLLTNYEPKPGVQYYRDLAGNIKQGPVGYAPVCHCGPSFRKIEQRMDADRSNMYDHIDAAHKMLSNRIEDVDHKCAAQVQQHEAHCRQRGEADARRRQEWLNTRILHERQDMEKTMRMQEHCMRAEYQDYVGRRFRGFEDHYAPLPSSCRGCEHCGGRTAHDDTDLHRSSAVTYGTRGGGAIYRTRSDETLSVSSSHPSKRHWKMKSSKSKSIREFKDRYLKNEGRRGERAGPSRVQEVRQPPQGQVNDKPMVIYEEKTASGRSPEGQSSGNDYTENSSYLDPVNLYGARLQKRQPIHPDLVNQVNPRNNNKELQQDFEKLTVRDFPQTNSGQVTSTPVAQPTRPAPQLPPKPQQSYPPAPDQQAHSDPPAQSQPNSIETTPKYSGPYNTPADNTPNFNTPNSSYNTTNCSSSRLTTSGSSYVLSPDQIQVHHSKTDSGSNPDSGYSSKVYGVRPAVSGKSIGSTQGIPAAPGAQQGQPLDLRSNMAPPQQSRTNSAPSAGFSRPTAPLPKQHPMPMVPPQHSRYPSNPQSNLPGRVSQYDNGTGPAKTVHKNRGYSSDGCPGMRRPKPDAYASDNCSGMRYPKSGYQYHRSVLTDWFEKHQSSSNGPIREAPSQDLNSHGPTPQTQNAKKPLDFWPGKATQV